MKEIKLTKGQFALVDDSDYEAVNKQKWYASKGNYTYYAQARPKKYGPLIHMHRVIMGLADKLLFIDHIDGNGLNNQRSNLRIATRSDNNSHKTSVGVSGFMGVFRTSAINESYFSRIIKHGKRYYLGSFHTKEEAAMAYDKKAIELHGEFANLNFK